VSFSSWARTPDGQAVVLLFFWWLNVSSIWSGVKSVRARYELIAVTQRARISCELQGGTFGAARGGEERCVLRAP
jgi:hypothetical protein